MGDRALVVFHDAREVSPTVYLHWGGSDVPNFLDALKELMKDRRGDVQYSAARFVGIAHEATPGNLSLGMWNTPDKMKDAVICHDANVLEEYSCGDAGVFVVDVRDHNWKSYGGYD